MCDLIVLGRVLIVATFVILLYVTIEYFNCLYEFISSSLYFYSVLMYQWIH